MCLKFMGSGVDEVEVEIGVEVEMEMKISVVIIVLASYLHLLQHVERMNQKLFLSPKGE